MTKFSSLYLDFLRVFAAFGVFFVHSSLPWFSNYKFLSLELGQRFVMMFFVLSGFVIANSTYEKNKNIKVYFLDRLSRLYSVVLPGLLLTYGLDWISRFYNPAIFSQIPTKNQWIKFFINFFFLQQVWNLSTRPSSNGTFWSLSYEFWFYCLFGFFYFFKGYKRYVFSILILLIMGLKIILLLPVWLFGCFAFYLTKEVKINKVVAGSLFIVTFLLIIFFLLIIKQSINVYQPPLHYSSNFLMDWVFGFIVGVHLFAVNFLWTNFSIKNIITETIRYLASITFSLYLYHFPFMVLVAAIIKYNKDNYIHLLPLLFSILVVIGILAEFTEGKRIFLRKKLSLLFDLR